MSNHKGGGMASKERLYELWMLYYTKVSASAEDPTVTPVVAAAPLPEVYNMSRQTHDRSLWGLCCSPAVCVSPLCRLLLAVT